jgi:hypothetical protein
MLAKDIYGTVIIKDLQLLRLTVSDPQLNYLLEKFHSFVDELL